MKQVFKKIAIEGLKIIFVVVFIVLPIRYFVFQPFIVRGASMEPNFEDADYLIVDQLSYRFSEPKRGDVIVFTNDDVSNKRYIKRVIGLPGEEVTVKGSEVVIKNESGEVVLIEDYISETNKPLAYKREEPVVLEDEEYFVMGDNRKASLDSRAWGALSEEDIIGRVLLQVSFFDKFSKPKTPEY
jgi:signal peptidase I